jgi:hypothetical protein
MGRRLVYTMGILSLAAAAGLLLAGFRGITDRLIPLYAVGAFLAFTLSQSGMVMHWLREQRQPTSDSPSKGAGGHGGRTKLSVRLGVNAVGAVATAGALAIILAAKFMEGAWITVLAIPALISLFWVIHRHYQFVEKQVGYCAPLVPIGRWDRLSRKCIRFAIRLSPEVIAVHLTNLQGDAAKDEASNFRKQWAVDVEIPARAAGVPAPNLEIVQSPYREFIEPVMKQIDQVQARYPHRLVAVIVGEIIERHWWESFLHSRRSPQLRAALQNRGDAHVVVIELPWFVPKEPDASVDDLKI